MPRNLKSYYMNRLISEKFSKFSFRSLNCDSWGKIITMITRMNFRILTNPPYINFAFSLKKSKNFPVKNLKNHTAWIRKNPCYHFCDFTLNLGIKMKILNFLGIQPIYESYWLYNIICIIICMSLWICEKVYGFRYLVWIG